MLVDVEVLIITIFGLGYPRHRYCHTLLIGAVLGILWGVAAYPLRHIFNRLMQLIRIPYQTSFLKMLISGVLGVWLHVLIDGIYHWDIRVFWPYHTRPLYGLLGQPTHGEVRTVCIAFFAAAVIVYAIMRVLSYKNKTDQTSDRKF